MNIITPAEKPISNERIFGPGSLMTKAIRPPREVDNPARKLSKIANQKGSNILRIYFFTLFNISFIDYTFL
ncbi:MAG: hypothetical protein BAJALOKI2v1_120033 [Promethearchaeota archaeon]|nr:MAG: hypothetical protein BAJALOKI2v1_120033 [Candidatus Lokiarchaeota archaeon]